MKLYVKDGDVYFDWTDIDRTDNRSWRTVQFRRFLREHNYYRDVHFDRTLKYGVFKLRNEKSPYQSEWEQAYEYRGEVKSAYWRAKENEVEISDDYEDYIKELDGRCEELYAAAVAAERERKEKEERVKKWNSLCKYGCGRCEHKRRDGDDFVCAYTGELLQEENRPGYSYNGTYCLFNYVAIPSDNCPYNINQKEKSYERISEAGGSSAQA